MVTLRKRKTTTNTPITIAVPKAQQDAIKRVPRQSLQAFKDNKQTPTDWYNLTFRTRIGFDLAHEVYTNETVVEMTECLNTCLAIKDRYLQTKLWTATPEEIESIEIGLDAIDQMQDETTRRVQLVAFKESDVYMKKLIKDAERRI